MLKKSSLEQVKKVERVYGIDKSQKQKTEFARVQLRLLRDNSKLFLMMKNTHPGTHIPMTLR